MITYFSALSNGTELRGLLHQGERKIPVIIIHGFLSSNKIGPYRLYYQFADFLNNCGFTVLRIDFSAMGESDGDAHRITFDTHISDLCNVVMALLKREGAEKVHIIAHCVGCCTSLRGLEQLEAFVASLSLIAPIIPTPTNFKVLLGEDGYSKLMGNLPIYHNGMYCDKSFFRASETINDVNLISKAKASSIKVFFPGKDQFSQIEDGIVWARTNSVNYEIIPNADHNFLDFLSRQQLFSSVARYLEAVMLK